MLIGPSEEAGVEDRIYVGESEDPQGRIDQHLANRDFWNRFVIFTSSGETLNKATIRYLEARLMERVVDAKRAELDNGNIPALPTLSEPDIADAESFLADMLVIFPILGVSAFESSEQPTPPAKRLRLLGPQAEAQGSETEDGFVVFSGALARVEEVESLPPWGKNLRHSLIQSGTFVPLGSGESYRLPADHVFKSPSAAAVALMGRSANGLLEWKDDTGKTLKQIREDAVAPPPPTPVASDLV